MRSYLRPWILAVAIACLLAPTRAALAGSAMLLHGLETVCVAPLEIAVSPYVAGDTLASNMESQHYSTKGKVFMATPYFIWMWMAQVGMAGGRAMAGVLEVPLGLALLPLPFKADSILNLDNEPALVERDPFRFGIYFARGEETPGS